MLKRRMILLRLAASVAVTGLVACGQQASTTGDDAAAATNADSTVTDADVAVDVPVAPDVFDPTGAKGFMKSPPLPNGALVQSRFQIPSTFTVGQFQPGVWVLPNGRLLTPAGTQVDLKSYPLGLVVHPNGKFVYISNDREDQSSVQVYDVAQNKLIQTLKRTALYRFLLVTPDGKHLYASGGPQLPTYRMTIAADGTLTDDKTYAAQSGLFAIGLSPDATKLYGVSTDALPAATNKAGFVVMDAESTATTAVVGVAATPYDMVVAPDGKHAFLLTWVGGNVQRVDLVNPAAPTEADTIALGSNGQGIVISSDGKTLWVSLVENDQIVQVDVASWQVQKRIPVGLSPVDQPLMAPRGRDPGLMALSPDGARLYVVCAMSNEVVVLDTAKGVVIGAIPVGWYPSAIGVSPDGKTLFVGNAKGTGTPPWDGTTSLESAYLGTLSVIPTPDDAALVQGQKDVLDNMIGVTGKGRLAQTEASKTVMPLAPGASPQIKHIVYIMRENKTFDIELGDIATEVNGDVTAEPKYALFGQEFTPNLHKLASTHCLLDNFYTDGDYSATGHGYATAAKPSDFIEKFYGLSNIGLQAWNVSADSLPGQGFLFANLIAWGYSVVDFGEIVGMASDPYMMDNVMQTDYPGIAFSLDTKDEVKAAYLETWLQTHDLPTFTFILLPVNHTCCGGSPDHVSPRSMVADNDAATGRVIEALSKTPAWHETVAFIFEDDPQDGGDSVAYHRSPLIVVSPWVKHGHVDHDHHATGSIHATMERLLDVTPLTELDGFASPIYGCFNDTADDGPFGHIGRVYPEITNKQEKGSIYWTQDIENAWNAMKFDQPDQNRGLGRLLWRMYKGTEAPWPNWRFSRAGDNADADD